MREDPPPNDPWLAAPAPPDEPVDAVRTEELEEIPPPPPPPGRRVWPWLLALAIAVLGGLLALWLATGGGDEKVERTVPATKVVPTVVSLPQAVATTRVTRAGFDAQIRFAASEQRKGMVIRQRPLGGTRLSPGNAIVLTVSGGKPKLAVPTVTGLPVAKAVQRLRAAGLETRQKVVFARESSGTVVRQAPAAGVGVRKGAAVLLTVSRGPQRVAVPPVVGETRAQAVALLKRTGLVPAVFSVPAAQPKGLVVAQRPQAGERAPKGSRVRINVSKGAPAAGGGAATTTPTATGTTAPATTTGGGGAARVEIPDVVGTQQLAAQRRLRAAGFVVRTSYVTSSRAAGTVVSQSPSAGTSAARGSTVRIGVSLGPAPKPARAVPDVTGEDEATATADLRRAGFTVEVVDQPTDDPNEEGVVLDEDPPPGTRAPAGSQVTIFVGRSTG